MNAANQRQLTPILVAIAVLLGAALLLLLSGVGRGARWDAPRSLAPLPPAGSAASLPQPLPLQQFALVWQKPLFSPDRKPVAHAANGGSSLGDLELTGIILTPGLRMALLHDKNGDRQVRLHEGESLPDGSVTLVEVHPRSALFDSSAGRTELKLPAGAAIDERKPDAAANPDRQGADADALMRVVPGGAGTGRPDDRSGNGRGIMSPPMGTPAQRPTPDHPAESAADRLRMNIQKRRAARAAAAHEGVR
ncbi:general secretion pathway protein GspN [Rhodanobacter glycinis]|uniref:general secretion pathway protein GspN n=1 Tax=Rhodanobacter glycinis TaxID=582702 RepID=UPI00112A1D2A|nr:general secretion pathway protein GspN [Rhodanobacter glycinis]TPG45875.1 general secretion pathway protein GspN [Rhodanobacter glycinis]